MCLNLNIQWGSQGKNGCFQLQKEQGLAVIFSHHQVRVKRRREDAFLLPKVKVEFRHLFLLQNRNETKRNQQKRKETKLTK